MTLMSFNLLERKTIGFIKKLLRWYPIGDVSVVKIKIEITEVTMKEKHACKRKENNRPGSTQRDP